jgi:hypothetical protein
VRVCSKGASRAKSQLQLMGHKRLSGIWDVRAGGRRMGIGEESAVISGGFFGGCAVWLDGRYCSSRATKLGLLEKLPDAWRFRQVV